MNGLKRYLPRLTDRTPAFLHRLGTHLEAGFGAREAFELARPPVRREVAERARAALVEGHAVHEALRALELLETSELAILAASELSGRLPEALERLAARREDARDRRRMLFARALYPLTLIHLVPLVMRSREIFLHGAWLGALSFVLACWLGIWMVAFALAFLVKEAERRENLARVSLSLPLVGPAFRARALTEYFRVLHGLYAAGIPLTEAHARAASTTPNPHLASSLGSRSRRFLEGGGTLTEHLRVSGVLRAEEGHLLETGERSGRLEETLERLARLCADEAASRSIGLVRLVAALLYGLAVLAVAWTAISFWTSYLDSYRSLR